ncbi:metallophosphoesterase [Acerihabitans sp. TG2]|uniref:metallophosphoesterase n=1 Tax=Acerihabitans sp. TG2 TaxID=3096008 RepID=UPI002B239F23|nr:metallophosphoesterase [Acerihabitans sp. TG2]MEA9391461.1 metallophosphoesterase [Acerihabitans sp. TG2]
MKILQLTDCHIFSTPDMTLHGHPTHRHLEKTINYILEHKKLGCEAVLVTGDISQDGSLASYQLALQQIERLQLPVFYIAGNHDDPDHLAFIFNSSPVVNDINHLCLDNWRFVAINTIQPGKDTGWLAAQELGRLEQQLLTYRSKNIALIMHHHPLPVGIPLVDDYRLLNGADIMELCHAHSHIKSLICGHAHTDYTERQNQCLITVGPATCFQWQPGTQAIQTIAKSGFNLLDFSEDITANAVFI